MIILSIFIGKGVHHDSLAKNVTLTLIPPRRTDCQIAVMAVMMFRFFVIPIYLVWQCFFLTMSVEEEFYSLSSLWHFSDSFFGSHQLKISTSYVISLSFPDGDAHQTFSSTDDILTHMIDL